MKEWSLNELFQGLLKAESQVLERERCQQGATNNAGLTEDGTKKLSSNKQIGLPVTTSHHEIQLTNRTQPGVQ